LAADLHVAPNGTADAPGTIERPLATLEQARDVIRECKKQGKLGSEGVTVWIHGGDYFREKSLSLETGDSGTAEFPVVYRNRPGETPRLIGGKRVEPSAWHAVSDPKIVARLAEPARAHVLAADLKPLGIANAAPLGDRFRSLAGTPELFFAGRPMQIARWPNEGWVTIERVVDRGSTGGGGEKPRGGTFVYREDRPSRWHVDGGVWLHGYWCHDWADECLRVASIDPEKREITLAAPHGYGIGPSSSWNREPRRYCAINVLEELDAAGEWFLDRRAGVLYFWPPAPVESAEVLLSTFPEPLVVLDGCEHVTLRGLALTASCGEGVVVRGGRDNLVAGCTLTNLGDTAVAIRGGVNNGVTSCDLSSLARSGITLDGGDRRSLTPAGNFAANNHIHQFGRLQRTYAAGIHVGGVGNRASHNLIHDAPHAAVLYGGNEHVLELNEIHHVAQETSDVGAFYTGRDWTSRGNLLRWNYIHDLGQMGAVGTMGVYLDDCDSGDRLVGNVFYKAGRAAFVGGGRDNLVENNLMIECDAAVHLDARGTTRITLDAPAGDSWNLLAKAERLDYRKPPWSARYPELASIMDHEPLLPLGNVVRRNVAYRCRRWLSANGMDKYLDRVEFSDNLVTDDDPGFVDAAGRDFRLRSDSPVFKIPGWEQIPIEKIGLEKDEYRAD
jgi:hypothetical protein